MTLRQIRVTREGQFIDRFSKAIDQLSAAGGDDRQEVIGTCYGSSASATIVVMSAIPARDLRNHTAEVLRRVEAGEEIEVLRDNRPVAKIIPLSWRRRWLPASEIASELMRLGPDTTGLAAELRESLGETTDDLPW